MHNEFTICKMCNGVDTVVRTGDVDYCDDCYSVEQGFQYLELYTDTEDVTEFIDEDGNIYDDDLSFIRILKDGDL